MESKSDDADAADADDADGNDNMVWRQCPQGD